MRIAFFIKRASRTGSEIALCNLISYAVKNGVEACVACRDGGEVLSQLPPSVPVFVYREWSPIKQKYAGLTRRLRGDGNGFTSFVNSRFAPDIWYVNTIIQPECVVEAKRKNVKCVVYSHELEHILADLSEEDARVTVSYPQLILANSKASLEVLRCLGRDNDIEVCYPSIDPQKIKCDSSTAAKLRRELGIGDRTFVWAMAGTLDPNKNPARFVSLAVNLLGQGHDVHFVWLGDFDSAYALYVKEAVRNSRFPEKITFAGARTHDYYDWLNMANGAVITSFKESFSLVAVEAAYLGKPVVSFDSGGTREIVRDGMGVVLDSWNDTDAIQAMLGVMTGAIPFNRTLAETRAREFSIELQGKHWLDTLTTYFQP